MALLIKHFGKVKQGRLIYNLPDFFNTQMLSLEGQEVEVIVKKRTKKTTLDQHRYYRGAILPACYQSEYFGHYDKPDDIHDYYFAPKFLSIKKLIKNHKGENEEVTKIISMTDMTTKETSEFIEKIIPHIAEMGIDVLSPQEYLNTHYK